MIYIKRKITGATPDVTSAQPPTQPTTFVRGRENLTAVCSQQSPSLDLLNFIREYRPFSLHRHDWGIMLDRVSWI